MTTTATAPGKHSLVCSFLLALFHSSCLSSLRLHMQEALTICNNPTLPGLANGDPNINILTGYGNITDKIMASFCFIGARRDQIRGADDKGNIVGPNALGSTDAEKLRKQHEIQNIKILFYKLKKSFTTACGKTLLPKLADFHEDGTELLICVCKTLKALQVLQCVMHKLT